MRLSRPLLPVVRETPELSVQAHPRFSLNFLLRSESFFSVRFMAAGTAGRGMLNPRGAGRGGAGLTVGGAGIEKLDLVHSGPGPVGRPGPLHTGQAGPARPALCRTQSAISC